MLRVHGPALVAWGAAEDALAETAADDVDVGVTEVTDVAVAVVIDVAPDGLVGVVEDEHETSSTDARRAAATRPTFTPPSWRRLRVFALEPPNQIPQRRSSTTVSSRVACSPFGPVASRERISAISVVQPFSPSDATSSAGLTNSW